MRITALFSVLLAVVMLTAACDPEPKKPSNKNETAQGAGAPARGSAEERANTTLFGVEVVDAQTAFAFGTNDEGFTGSVVLKTSDGGAHWNLVLRTEQTELVSVDFLDAQHGAAVSDGGTVYATSDGGSTWKASNTIDQFKSAYTLPVDPKAGTSAPYQALDGIFALGDKMIWVAGGREERRPGAKAGRIDSVTRPIVVMSADGGTTWKTVTSDSLPNVELRRVFFADEKNGWAAGGEADEEGSWGVLRSTDGGATWTKVNVEEKQSPQDLFFVDAKNGWMVGATEDDAGDAGPSEVMATKDGGATWQRASRLATSLQGVRFADAQNGWVVGNSGKIYRTTDGGATWSEQTTQDWSGGQVIDMTDPLYPSGASQPTFTALVLTAPGKGWASTDLGVYAYKSE